MNLYEKIYAVLTEQAMPPRDPGEHEKLVGKRGLEREKIQRSDRPRGWRSKLQKPPRGEFEPPRGEFGVTKDETEEDVTRQRVARRGEARQRALTTHQSGKLTAAALKSRIRSIGSGEHDWPRHSTDPKRRPQGVPIQRPKKF